MAGQPLIRHARDGTSPPRPGRHVKIAIACAYGGDSRSGLYLKAAKTPGLFVKNGRATLVDLDVYDRLIDARPVVVLKGQQS